MRKVPALKFIYVGFGLLLLGLTLADIVNSSTLDNQMRGAANIIFATINFAFLAYIFHHNPRAILFVLLGQSLARVLSVDTALDLVLLEQSNGFKAHVVPVVFPLILTASYFLVRVRLSFAILAAVFFGLLFVVLNARSKGLVILLGVSFLILANTTIKREQKILITLTMVVALYGLYAAYVAYVLANPSESNGYIQLSSAVAPYNPFSLLAQGRTDAVIALFAIAENPFVGRGSWAVDVDGVFAAHRADLLQTSHFYDPGYITSHSVLLTAWMWGGLIGLMGCLFVFFTILRRGLRLARIRSPYQLIVAILIVDFLWNSFFSPFGHLRTTYPVIGAFVLTYLPWTERLAENRRRGYQ